MNARFTYMFLVLFCFAFPAAAQQQDSPGSNTGRKAALVIGNSAYEDGPLLNPANDARDMAEALRGTGFEVLEHTDVETLADMKRAIREFGHRIENGGVGLFYYAGHGIQVNGKNYLIPTKAEIYAEEEVEYEAVDVGFVLAQMEIARNRMNIIILDACRNNPFARSWRSAATGLAFIDAPAGTMIAYATAPGKVASDGTGENGLYTQELLKQIHKKGMKIEDVFKNVRINVMQQSGNQQTPWESSSLVGDFYFIEPEIEATGPGTQGGLAEGSGPEENIYTDKSSSPEATWSAGSSSYRFYISGMEVTSELSAAPINGNLLVYHPGSGRSFLLEDFYNRTDNKVRPAVPVESPSGAFWSAGEEGYWLLVNGQNVTPGAKAVWVDSDLLVYVTGTSAYYLLRDYNNRKDLKLRAAEKVFSTNGTLWRVNQGYWLYVNGESVGNRTYNSWSGNDLIVWDEQGKGSYLLKDYYNRNDNVLRPAEVLAGPGVMTWKRVENTYYVYRNGNLISNEASVSYSGNDLLVYEKPTQQTILCRNWQNLNDGQLREAEVLFSPIATFWRREGNTYYLYRQGLLVSGKLESKWNGPDLEVTDTGLSRTYVLPSYRTAADNELHAAVLRTEIDFR